MKDQPPGDWQGSEDWKAGYAARQAFRAHGKPTPDAPCSLDWWDGWNAAVKKEPPPANIFKPDRVKLAEDGL